MSEIETPHTFICAYFSSVEAHFRFLCFVVFSVNLNVLLAFCANSGHKAIADITNFVSVCLTYSRV